MTTATAKYLNTLYVVDHRTKLWLRKGSLMAATDSGPRRRIAMNGLEAVIMFAGQITTDAIAACVEQGIRVAVLKRSGKVRFTADGPTAGNVHLRIAQVDATRDTPTARKTAAIIVAAKTRNSAALVNRWASSSRDASTATKLNNGAEKIQTVSRSLNHTIDRDTIRGMEGDAARTYFSCMASHLQGSGWTFSGRNRRPPQDQVNALLSFCYGLLTSEYIGACDAVGLDPQLGFLHQAIRAGRPSMALDLMEEARPLADRFVVSILKRQQAHEDWFEPALGNACYLSDEGRKALLLLWEADKERNLNHPMLGRRIHRWALPTVQTTLMARWLRGDLPDYPPFVARS